MTSAPDHAAAKTHLIQAISSAAVDPEPFPHFHIEPALPLPFYTSMKRMLPPDSVYKKWTDVGKVKNPWYGQRIQWYLEPDWMLDIPEPERSFWEAFGSWFLGDEVAEAVLQKFRLILEDRFGGPRQTWPRLYPQAIILRHRHGYYIGPHTDMPSKVANILLYFPEDGQNSSDIGTTLYRPHDPSFGDPGTQHYGFDGFTAVETMPFRDNFGFGFVKTDHSWHGVAPITEDQAARSRRDVIQYMIYDNPQRAPRKDLAEIRQASPDAT